MDARAVPVLLASDARWGVGRMVLLGIAAPSWIFLTVSAVSANRPGLWFVLALHTLLCFAIAFWSRRIVFNPATGVLFEESGISWLRLAYASRIGDKRLFHRVLCTPVPVDRYLRMELSLDGSHPCILGRESAAELTPTPVRAAAVALLLQLPLEEQSAAGGRARPLPAGELAQRVAGALDNEEDPGEIARACAAMLFGNGVSLLGVLFAHWSAASVYALFWLDLCAIVLFTVLRVAGADSRREVAPAARVAIFMLLAPGALVLLSTVGDSVRLALDLPEDAVLHGIREGGAWFALLALIGGHVAAYAVDLRRGARIPAERIGRLLAIAVLRIMLTMVVAGLAAVFLQRVPGAGASAVLAVLIAARGAFEVWAHLAVHAPLWLAGDLELLRAAGAAPRASGVTTVP